MAYRDPASTEAQEEEEDRLDALTIAAEYAILAMIAKGMSRAKDGITIYEALAMYSSDLLELQAELERIENELYATISEAWDRMSVANDKWAEKFYDYVEKPPVKTEENILLKAKKQAGKKAAIMDATSFINPAIVNTSVIGIGDGINFKPIQDEYVSAVSKAINALVSGEATYDQVIAKTTRELAKSGVKVQYASGVKRSLDAAVRTNVMDGYRDTMAQLRELHGKNYGANAKEISAHLNCAPDHLPYQGNQYYYEDFRKLNEGELKHRPITTGANCRHMAYDVIYGVKPTYTEKQLEEINKQSEREITFEGLSGKPLTMSNYEATQYQRGLERRVREIKMNNALAEIDGAPKINPRPYTAYYRSFCEETGLTPRPKRMRLYM